MSNENGWNVSKVYKNQEKHSNSTVYRRSCEQNWFINIMQTSYEYSHLIFKRIFGIILCCFNVSNKERLFCA